MTFSSKSTNFWFPVTITSSQTIWTLQFLGNPSGISGSNLETETKIVGFRDKSYSFETVILDCSSIVSAKSLSQSLFFIFFYFLAIALFSNLFVNSSMFEVNESYLVVFSILTSFYSSFSFGSSKFLSLILEGNYFSLSLTFYSAF